MKLSLITRRAVTFLLAVALICTLCLYGCSEKKSTVLISGMAEGNTIIPSLNTDIDLSAEIQELNAEKKYEYVLDNEVFYGEYSGTLVSPYYNCDADIYIASGTNGKEIEFHVNRRKNKVVVYTLAYRNGYTTTQEKSYEECLQIAKEKLSEFDGGIFEQVFKETHMKAVYIPECGNTYSYYFRKMIDEKETNIIVQIDVNTDGLVVLVNASSIFEFDGNDESVIRAASKNVENLLEKVKNRLLSEVKNGNKENISFAIQRSSFCKLKDGNIYVLCEVEIRTVDTHKVDYVQVLVSV